MSRTMKGSMIAAFLVALAAATGCEDSPVTAGKHFQIYVIALPPTVRVDPDNPTDPLTSRIVATIVSDTGAPQKGLLVFFSADGGELSSGNQPVRTDANGNAFDTLTIDPDGPGDITVTASSTSLSDSVTVTNGACTANAAPAPPVFTVPTPVDGPTAGEKTVNLTATATDNGTIVSWSWDCGNQTSGGTGTTPTPVGTCVYAVGTGSQIYQITLTVKDNGLGGTGPTYACQKSAFKTNSVTIAP